MVKQFAPITALGAIGCRPPVQPPRKRPWKPGPFDAGRRYL